MVVGHSCYTTYDCIVGKQEIFRLVAQFNLIDVTSRLSDLLIRCLGIDFVYLLTGTLVS
jgi:hypothetical protein